MITLSQVNQYAMDNDLGDDTDIFTILSKMQLIYENTIPQGNKAPISVDSHIEWTTEDLLDLFST